MNLPPAIFVRANAGRLPFPDGFFQCVVTSIPYFGLRSYRIANRVFGGDPGCTHEWRPDGHVPQPHGDDGRGGSGLQGGTSTQASTRFGAAVSATCTRCGQWWGQLGQEPGIEMFIAHMVEIFREVWRVLRDDGVFWLNAGDSFAGSGCGPTTQTSALRGTRTQAICSEGRSALWYNQTKRAPEGLKPKDLMLVPSRLAQALQGDGWYVRAAMPWIAWNRMPESVSDRPGVGHEDIYLLTKSPRYFFDADAVRVPQTGTAHARGSGVTPKDAMADAAGLRGNNRANAEKPFRSSFHASTSQYVDVPGGRRRRTTDWFRESLDRAIAGQRAYLQHLEAVRKGGGMLLTSEGEPLALVANTKGFRGAHFATFPEALVEPMLKASTPEAGCCPQCGAPWARVTARTVGLPASYRGSSFTAGKTIRHQPGAGRGPRTVSTETLGFRPTCACYDDLYRNGLPRTRDARKRAQQDARGDWFSRARRRPAPAHWPRRPAWVLDPFCGTGTVNAVARRLGLASTGVDLAGDYLDMARVRLGAILSAVEVEGPAEAQQLRLFEADKP